jgi:uncharacterized protein (TIGR02466 family)
MVHIHDFFPIPVGTIQIDEVLNQKIIEFIKIKQLNLESNNGGGGNSISSDVYILDKDEFSDIKQVLTESVNEYFKEIVNPGKDTKLYITNSWINVNKNGESHHRHKHPNSIVSATLYLDTCEGDTISFMNQNNELFGNLDFSNNPPTKYMTPEWTAPAIINTLMIFPSTLPHGVNPRPNTCTGTRISLSFNTWIKGTIGGGQGETSNTLHFY